MSFHPSMLGRGAARGVVSDNAKKLSDVIKRIEQTDRVLHATAEPVSFINNEPQSWITSCPHCERIIGVTLAGNGK